MNDLAIDFDIPGRGESNEGQLVAMKRSAGLEKSGGLSVPGFMSVNLIGDLN